MRLRTLLTVSAALALSACNLAPVYNRPAAPIPASLPAGGTYPTAATASPVAWRTLITDQKLAGLIETGLKQNRDLRASLAQVQAARALYGVQRASHLPSVTGGLSTDFEGGDANSRPPRTVEASLGIPNFELDLFGRLRNLSKAAFEQYLASEAGARSARISLVSEIASAYVTYAYDQDVLHIGQDTRTTAQQSLDVTQQLNKAGLAERLDVVEATTVLHQAESDIANSTTQVAQDRNALELLVGGPVDEALLPASLAALDPAISRPAAGISSEVLLNRPDVLEAEARLKGANANIGAARAAFFPRISLTAALGTVSSSLSSLFDSGGETWTVTPSASVAIFSPAVGANVDYAKAQRELALAQYEGSLQSAFRETADALARAGTIGQQRDAQRALVEASQEAFQLSDQRYRAGIDTYLSTLTSQRALDSARRGAAATTLSDLLNRLALYRVLGGGPAD